MPDAEGVENVLVRLSDGEVLAVLGGNYWTRGEYRANQFDTDRRPGRRMNARWSRARAGAGTPMR